jgi:hypothetical protein
VHGPVIVRKQGARSYFADTNDIQQPRSPVMPLFSLLYIGFQFAALTIVLFLVFRGVTILQRMALDLEAISRAAQAQIQPLNVDRP